MIIIIIAVFQLWYMILTAWPTLEDRHKENRLSLLYRISIGTCPMCRAVSANNAIIMYQYTEHMHVTSTVGELVS